MYLLSPDMCSHVLQLTGDDPDRFADPEDDEEQDAVPDTVHPSSSS